MVNHHCWRVNFYRFVTSYDIGAVIAIDFIIMNDVFKFLANNKVYIIYTSRSYMQSISM